MAHHCQHLTNFSGSPENIAILRTELQRMRTLCNETNEGQFPTNYDEDQDGRPFFDLAFSDENETEEYRLTNVDTVHWCKWSTNTDVLKFMAVMYNVDMLCNYEESGSQVYGRASYKDGFYMEVDVPTDVMDAKDEDEETDYDTWDKILDAMEAEQLLAHKAEFKTAIH